MKLTAAQQNLRNEKAKEGGVQGKPISNQVCLFEDF